MKKNFMKERELLTWYMYYSTAINAFRIKSSLVIIETVKGFDICNFWIDPSVLRTPIKIPSSSAIENVVKTGGAYLGIFQTVYRKSEEKLGVTGFEEVAEAESLAQWHYKKVTAYTTPGTHTVRALVLEDMMKSVLFDRGFKSMKLVEHNEYRAK